MQFGLVLEQKTMAQSNWEADKMLDVYIYDYLMKKKLHATAKSFMTEGKVAPDPVAIDAPGGSPPVHLPLGSMLNFHVPFFFRDSIFGCHNLLPLRMIKAFFKIGRLGLNPGVGGLPLKGWPLTGIDQIRPSLGAQVQKPFLQNANQLHLLPQQQLLAQVQAQGNLGSSPIYGDMDPQRFRGLSRGTLNAKDGQLIANDGSLGSPMQSTSSKINMPQIQQSSSQQQQDPLHPQQVQQNNRKRKGPSSSGAANSTGTGNTIGPSPNSQPSTPSTHTPGDGVAMAGNLQNVGSVSKGLMMYGADGAGALASSTNQLDDMDHFGDVGSLDDNVESFLSHDDGDGRDLFGAMKRNPSEHHAETSKGFSFNEVGSMCKSNSKVVCCHFSSDGKLLASAGHDKKVVLWNMETLQTESTPEEHSMIITDVRFRPNSTQLATSSFDTTVRLWDAAKPSYVSQPFTGHASHVMSLDFSPKNNEILCSCDANSEIRFWNINQYSCTRAFKGGSAQVRFQPRIGQLLAAAAEKVVSIFDVETDRQTHSLRGHTTDVHSICWDTNGDYLASASQESVRVWSLASGDCIHELSSSGNMYHSCVFHPSYPTLLVIGGYQSLELWNLAENKCMTIAAHDCVIAALAQSPLTGMVASASHDKSVKIWK
ncbi:transcriptional corepressor LEUNIG_HOMOLOG [Quercus suber]|uniref:transcriptional corepressor LEUNIG_HOMOLOG n=1 Tax=Quercus suber TaxID=58331 RepID=UPI0032DFA911